jgi:hypothetical protein
MSKRDGPFENNKTDRSFLRELKMDEAEGWQVKKRINGSKRMDPFFNN